MTEAIDRPASLAEVIAIIREEPWAQRAAARGACWGDLALSAWRRRLARSCLRDQPLHSFSGPADRDDPFFTLALGSLQRCEERRASRDRVLEPMAAVSGVSVETAMEWAAAVALHLWQELDEWAASSLLLGDDLAGASEAPASGVDEIAGSVYQALVHDWSRKA